MSISWSDDLGVTDDVDRFEEAIRAFRKRVPMTDDEWLTLSSGERERAFKVANVAQADLVQEVFDALDSAIANGTTLEDFQAEVGAQLAEAWEGADSARCEGIFRTNVMGAYNEGTHDVLDTPEAKEARPYWRFELIDDDRLCEICAPFEGIVLPADDPFWSEAIPPLHVNCRCPHPSPLTEDEALEEGLTDEPPSSASAADGFGEPPSVDDWEPEPARFNDAISGEIERKLASGGE